MEPVLRKAELTSPEIIQAQPASGHPDFCWALLVSPDALRTTEITFKLNRGESGVNESRSDPKMCTASTTPIHFSVVVQFCIFLATRPDGQRAKRRQRCYE